MRGSSRSKSLQAVAMASHGITSCYRTLEVLDDVLTRRNFEQCERGCKRFGVTWISAPLLFCLNGLINIPISCACPSKTGPPSVPDGVRLRKYTIKNRDKRINNLKYDCSHQEGIVCQPSAMICKMNVEDSCWQLIPLIYWFITQPDYQTRHQMTNS